MKKTLVTLLALVFVLSVGTAAFAAPANPFVDVPAKHWAYDAVTKLAKAGIVDGYGDGTFRGDRSMTRYEMAQIVAKAMARSDKADAENKALIDKLAVEFASELNNLGVRVAKLEANASSVKVTGDLRARYTHVTDKKDQTQLKLGLNLAATVNDNVSFNGRIAAQNKYSDHRDSVGNSDNQYNDQFDIERAYITVKDLGGMKLTAGRQYLFLGQGILHDADYFDGGLVTIGNQLKVTFGYGDISTKGAGTEKLGVSLYRDSKGDVQGAANLTDSTTIKVLNLSYDVNPNFNLTAAAMYSGSKNYGINGKAFELQAFGFNYKLNNDWALLAEYSRNANADDKKNAWYAQVNYKTFDKAVPGSYDLWLNYARAEANAYDGDMTTLNADRGQKGWTLGWDYALAKNVQMYGFYSKFKDTHTDEKADDYYRLAFKFFF